jgi:hypothetical protein
MNAAIASHTQINRFLGIKSKQLKKNELSAILTNFTAAVTPEELKRHLKEFIEHAKQHRALQFFDSPTKSIRAFNNKLDDNLRAVVDEIIKPKSGDESTPKHI